MHRGYIKLWRKVQKNFLWKEKRVFSKAEAWIDILMEVRHSEEPETIIIKNKILKCYYAESLYSLETWADRWNWTRSKVKRFLVLLSSPGCSMIVTKSETVTTRLKVINYDVYAGMRNADETEVKRKRNASETQVDTNKNVKNVKNDKEIYSSEFKFKIKTPIPTNIFLTDKMREYVKKQGCENSGHADQLFEDFKTHHGAKGTKWQDWTLVFFKWVRNDKKFYNSEKYEKLVDAG